MEELTEKEKAELYYKLERIESDLKIALKATREEPGFSLQSVSKVIRNVFKPEELERLISFLQWKDDLNGRSYNKKQ
jgi:hypothetical protein